MSKYFKKELPVREYLFYCKLEVDSKSKRIRKKANKIVTYQIEEYYPLF